MNSTVVSNETEKVAARLSQLSVQTDTVHVAVAYLSSSEPIASWIRSGKSVKLVVALQPPTDAAVLRRLVDSSPVNLEARFYSSQFHSKLCILFKNRTPEVALVGSSNFTGGGLYSNLESNVVLREPKQLQELSDHFNRIWESSADLEPGDIDKYQKFCEQTKDAIDALRMKQKEFELRVVKPRLSSGRVGAARKEARDYLGFWKAVDDVGKIVGNISARAWPSVPLYLVLGHFWYWLVNEWSRAGLENISTDPILRTKRLRILFTAYVAWDKGTSNYVESKMKEDSKLLQKILSRDRMARLTRAQAQDVYNRLYSGHMRARRFGADLRFVKNNTLMKIRRSLAFLLWSESDVRERISALLTGGRHHLAEFGPSNIQELIGWVHPDQMPIRNDKADEALEMIGYRFR